MSLLGRLIKDARFSCFIACGDMGCDEPFGACCSRGGSVCGCGCADLAGGSAEDSMLEKDIGSGFRTGACIVSVIGTVRLMTARHTVEGDGCSAEALDGGGIVWNIARAIGDLVKEAGG
jgi:hypothetical protein